MSGELPEPDIAWTSRHTIPTTWCWTTLAQIADVKGGLAKGKKRGPNQETRAVPYLRVANVQRGRLDLSEMKRIEASEAEIAELRLKAGDILFNEGGDRDKLGRGWVWNGQIDECIHQNHVFRARLYGQDISPELLSMYGNTFGQAYFIGEGKQTTNLASVSLSKLSAFPVPLIPAREQRRIIGKVEALFARSANARDELAHIPRLIERYRQAVLEAAFRGDLTADWRRDNGPAATIAERTVDMLVMEPIRNGLSVRGSDDPPGIPALRLSALRQDKVNLSDCRYLPISTDKARRYMLREGDVLISRGNGTKSFVARSSLVPTVETPIIFPDTAFRVRLNPQVANPEWFSMLWNAPQVRDQIENLAKTTAGIWKVSQGDLTSVDLRVPSVAEQIETVRRIKMAFTAIGAIDAEVGRGINQLARLDQSILDKAFAGELVPQDPADEPASALLARIKAARVEAPASRRGRKAKG